MTFRTRVNPLVNALRSRAGKRLRFVADRLDPDHAPRWSGYTFVLDHANRPIFHQGDRRAGCMLWYLGHEEREKAYPIEGSGHASGGWATSNRFAHVPTSGPVEYSGDWGQTHYDENGEIPNADHPARRHVEDMIADAARIIGARRGGIAYPRIAGNQPDSIEGGR